MEKELKDQVTEILVLTKLALDMNRERITDFEIVMGDMRETMKLMKEVLDSDELKTLLKMKKGET